MEDVVVAPPDIHGLGVFVARGFRADETLPRVEDPRKVDGSHPLRPGVGDSGVSCDNLEERRVVRMLAPERHIKFSCEPNTFVKSIRGMRHVLARRPTRAGKEITDDCIINCPGGDVSTCRCGSDRCRSTIVCRLSRKELG
jgi:hypothetical protein